MPEPMTAVNVANCFENLALEIEERQFAEFESDLVEDPRFRQQCAAARALRSLWELLRAEEKFYAFNGRVGL